MEHRKCECCRERFLLKDMKDDLCVCCYNFIQKRKDKKIADLEAKLAESEKELNRYAELFGMKDKDFYVVEKTEYEKMKQGAKDIVMQLKQQLAEKEKENDFLKLQTKEYLEKGMLIVRQQDLWAIDEKHNQDKISFALEQLEKVRKDIDCYMAIREGDLPYNIECLLLDFADKIDNQIKQLKEGK